MPSHSPERTVHALPFLRRVLCCDIPSESPPFFLACAQPVDLGVFAVVLLVRWGKIATEGWRAVLIRRCLPGATRLLSPRPPVPSLVT